MASKDQQLPVPSHFNSPFLLDTYNKPSSRSHAPSFNKQDALLKHLPKSNINSRIGNHNRPQTSLKQISDMTMYKKKKANHKLDVLNWIIETNPNKYDLNKLSQKIRDVNTIFSPNDKVTSLTAIKPNISRNLDRKTEEVYYKYNILYGGNTNKIIRTYSPKMRPMSASVTSFTKNMVMDDTYINVFSNEELTMLIQAKCKDWEIELREKMIFQFMEYCRSKCRNSIVDFSECNMGLNSVAIISGVWYSSDRITRLNLSKNNIGDKGVELLYHSIKDSTSLLSLNLTSNSISPKGGNLWWNAMINQQSIIDWNVSSWEGINRNRFGHEGWQNSFEKFLERNGYIEFLNISGNSIKNEGFHTVVSALNKNISIHALDISSNDIDAVGIEKGWCVLEISKVTELNISNNCFKNDGLHKLVDAFEKLPNLRKINVSNCGIDYKGVFYLFLNWQKIKRIETVNWSHNEIHSPNFSQLKPFFAGFGVKSLNFTKCGLGDISGSVLGDCWINNESIRKIYLSDNKISDKGFKAFVPLFWKNLSIEVFDISKNFITDATAKPFIMNAKDSRSLKTLNWYDNQMKNDTGSAISDLLVSNKKITAVNVQYNRIQIKIIDEINKRCKANALYQKSKFIPNLVKEIKSLKVNPKEFRFAEKKIRKEKEEAHYLNIQLQEDLIKYPKWKEELQAEIDAVIDENRLIEEEISELDHKLFAITNEIKDNKKTAAVEIERLTEVTNKELEEIKILEKEKEKLEQENTTWTVEYQYNFNKVSDMAKTAREKTELNEMFVKNLKNKIWTRTNALEELAQQKDNAKMKKMGVAKSQKNAVNNNVKKGDGGSPLIKKGAKNINGEISEEEVVKDEEKVDKKKKGKVSASASAKPKGGSKAKTGGKTARKKGKGKAGKKGMNQEPVNNPTESVGVESKERNDESSLKGSVLVVGNENEVMEKEKDKDKDANEDIMKVNNTNVTTNPSKWNTEILDTVGALTETQVPTKPLVRPGTAFKQTKISDLAKQEQS